MKASRLQHILLTLSLLLGLTATAAKPADTSTAIFNPAFHTLQLKVNGNDMLPPVIMTETDDHLTISFDELSDERRYMRYELIHCNARWQPDELVSTEYLDGFNEAAIDDYAYSQATTVHYVNYSFSIPSEDMRPKLSGNYLVRVYDESDPDATILQARFSILERAMDVTAAVSSRTDIDYNNSHQQLTVGVDFGTDIITSPFTDLLVVVEQNGRQDNVAYASMPSRVAGSTAWYEHDKALIFPAGNEYRRMEIISVTYPGMGVAELSYAHPLYHATLKTDEPRADQPYAYDQTQHGRFRIREYNSDDPDVEADYVMTHFSLDLPEQPNAGIFLDGDMVQRRFTPESRMVYNRATGLYEQSLLLKQGAYNYQYLTVPTGSDKGLTAPVEGDKYQTVNTYLIKVYARRPGQRYDRLVGATSVTSGV